MPVVFVLFLLALVVVFSDFVFSDQMLYGSDTLQQGYMFRHYLIDYVKEHGAIPQWIPYYFGGMPYVEAFHGDIFYPLTLLKYVFPLKRMLGWHLFVHIFLAGVFMYFCARQFKMSKIPSLVAAASYMYAGYLVSMVAPGHDGKIYVTAFFPLIMLFLDRGYERRSFFSFTMLGTIIGVIILAPHAQMSYFTLWGVSFYAAFKLTSLWWEKRAIAPLIKPAGLTVYAVAIGLLLSAIQFYPGYVYTSEYSPRSDSKRGWEWAISWSLHEEEVVNLIIPEFSGASTEKADTYYWGKNWFKDNCETAGTVPFLLALFGFLFYRRKESYFFGGLALFALIYGLGATTPIFKLFFWIIPLVDKLRSPSMIMFMFSFSAAMLSAMGVQHVINLRREKKAASNPWYTYILAGFPALLLLVALLFAFDGKGMLRLWTSLFYSSAATDFIQRGITKLDVAYANLSAIQSGAWYAFLFAAIASGFMWLYMKGKAGAVILLGLVALIVIDGVRFDKRFVKTVDERTYQERYETGPLVQFFQRMQKQEGQFRVVNMDSLNDNRLPFFDVDITTGYHGNQLRWYNALLGPELIYIRQVNPRVFNLTGSRYIINPANQQIPPNWFGEKPLMKIADVGNKVLLRNDNAFPRVFLKDSYSVYPDRETIDEEILNGESDLWAQVILEEEPDLAIQPDTLGSDSAWLKMHQPDTVKVGLSVTGSRLLVLADNYYDAWHATIDGTPAKIIRAYGTFRAVAVPAGSKEVVFTFRSERYVMARMVSMITALYLLGVLGGMLYFGYKRPAKATKDDTGNSDEQS